MQFDINKEVRDYKETLFFGLNLRQCVCSALAIIVAIGLYFSLKNRFSNEHLSWVCMLGAAPFAAMGFFKYQGMTAEQFAMNWVYTVLLEPKCFPFQTEGGIKLPYKKKRKERKHVQENQTASEAV